MQETAFFPRRARRAAPWNEGVKPDIEVEITPADRVAGRDPQLERAIDFVKGKLPAGRFAPPRPETQPSTSPPPKPAG